MGFMISSLMSLFNEIVCGLKEMGLIEIVRWVLVYGGILIWLVSILLIRQKTKSILSCQIKIIMIFQKMFVCCSMFPKLPVNLCCFLRLGKNPFAAPIVGVNHKLGVKEVNSGMQKTVVCAFTSTHTTHFSFGGILLSRVIPF